MKQNIAYLDEDDKEITEDISNRKEFYIFKKNLEAIKFQKDVTENDINRNILPKISIDDLAPDSNYLELKSYQMFVNNYFNANTPYTRLLIKWMTGFGKTIGSIAIALDYIKYFKLNRYENIKNKGYVYVIGFTQSIFKNELIKYPEFGFISRNELKTLTLLKKNAHYGNPADVEKLRNFKIMIKRRFGNEKNNGYFKFIGYKELALHLFESNGTEEIRNAFTLSQEKFIAAIDEGKIKLNKITLDKFANSLVICDEVHNLYNTTENNNWGLALQVVLNYHNTIRALFLSATPLNNSPTEVIDLLNFLLPRQFYPVLNKKDFFNQEDLIKGKDQEIADMFKGRISFIRDKNPKAIAGKKFNGEEIPGIDYLKFIRCPMSEFQYNTYLSSLDVRDRMIGFDMQYIMDFTIPDPTVDDPFSKTGLFKPNEIRQKMSIVDKKWKLRYGISYDTKSETIKLLNASINDSRLLEIISNKYTTMVKMLFNNLKNGKGKTFIFHNFIHMSGVLFIQEVLLQNNIIGEYDASTDNTLCICGKSKKMHSSAELNPLLKGNKSHIFKPVRFVSVHSGMDKTEIDRVLENFNSVSNATGSNIMILIGSRILKESHSLNSVRNLFVMSRPDNISTLIQIIGRALRLNSHDLLPEKDRMLKINLFVSSVQKKDALSYEEERYQEKIKTFKTIQFLEKIMHENAIDKYFNYDTIWNNSTIPKVSNISEADGIDILPYKRDIFKPSELNLSTFNAFYAKDMVTYITVIIKRLFIEVSSVWNYKDLLSAVHKPPFHVELDSSLVDKDLFNIALNGILYHESEKYTNFSITDGLSEVMQPNIMDKLRNPDDKIIVVIEGIEHVIVYHGELYYLTPLMEELDDTPKEHKLINKEPFLDFETISRNTRYQKAQLVDLYGYLNNRVENFETKKTRFIERWRSSSLIELEQSMCEFGIEFHALFLEDVIKYIFMALTTGTNRKFINRLFYVKMLYFYSLYNLVIWANVLDKNLVKEYVPFITKQKLTDKNDLVVDEDNWNTEQWVSINTIKKYERDVSAMYSLISAADKSGKVSSELLPVGHYVHSTRFYSPKDGWIDYKTANLINVKENPIIIGYDYRQEGGISIKFKLRKPVKNDSNGKNYIEKGIVCSARSKKKLLRIAARLGVVIDTEIHIDKLCTAIRNRLVYLELLERGKKNRTKYFYSILERS